MEYFSKVVQTSINVLYNASNVSIAIALVTLLVSILAYHLIRDNGVPPGPTGLPFLGYWPFLVSETCHLKQLQFKKKYGDVFSFRITGKLYINLASHKVLREAHITKSEYFAERTSDYNLLGKVFENGLVFSNGEKWSTIRKFFFTQFRERGMSLFKDNTAEAMYETSNALVEELKRNTDKPLDIVPMLVEKSVRIVHDTLFGITVSFQDVYKLQDDYRASTKLIHSSNMLLIGKFAKYFVMPFLPGFKEGMKENLNLKNSLLRIIEDHKKTFDASDIRDIIDSFILEEKTRKSTGDPTAKFFTDETLAGALVQFVGDGSINVASFITIFIKALLANPAEQEKIYNELLEVCGEDRNPGLQDKSNLPYTNAFLLEAQRLGNFLPLFPSLQCTRETTVGGYRIPKGAITILNAYAIHNDPQVYEEPDKFNPSRFLTPKGKAKPESPITFGVGKRVCLGESFVMMQVFLFCTTLIKNFKLSVPPSRPDCEKSAFSVNVRKRDLEIMVTARK